MIGALEAWMMGLDGWMIYVAVFVLMSMNGFISTPPSELTWGIAGYLVAKQDLSLLLCLLAGVTGNFLGTLGLFYIGKCWGERVIRRIFAWNPFIGDSTIEFAQNAFNKYGEIIVALGRCIPQIRSIISIPAGIVKMSVIRFGIFTIIGCLAWGVLWGSLGWSLGPALIEKLKSLKDLRIIIGIVIIILILLYFFWWLHKRIEK